MTEATANGSGGIAREAARVEVYGIRHHGPGSARAVRRALEEFRPDAVLVEGPPEADAIVDLAADPGMVPPVALLAYAPGEPPAPGEDPASGSDRRAAFWPFAEFSPEWQAVRYALDEGAAVRFCDLPAANQLIPPVPENATGDDLGPAHEGEGDEGIRLDPLGWLARAAGYEDAERWWDDVVEHRDGGPSPFPAIAEAMAELRERVAEQPSSKGLPPGYLLREEQREAAMRRTLRRALKDGFERVAVVCGAWHVPAILAKVPAARDDQVLRGLPKAKVSMTWVPWTHGRLAERSGYGAGVRSPGWYAHLFAAPDRPVERWLTDAAGVLRQEDLHVSSAHVIEAVRLAEALAALRGRPLAGLDEVTEATRAVLCEGADLPVELIRRRMVVGERLGSVPDDTPMVPLQRDLADRQRRLRLAPSADSRDLDLDLRRDVDLARSRLLHRLRLLEVDWGVPAESRGKGTFRETWTLCWRPEFDVELIEASAWGTTVAGASAARACAMAAEAESLAELTAVVERCLLADLDEALPAVMWALADRAALDGDVAHLMDALPALVRALRYGDVRATGTGPLRTVVDGLVVRVCVGLVPASRGLDDDAARDLLGRLDRTHAALALLDDAAHTARWHTTLAALVDRDDLHGLLEGRLTRLLLDAGILPDVPDRMARAVSAGAAPARAAAWVEGFLSEGGLVLVHDDVLLRLVDGWITGLPAEAFTGVLPLLRRAFGEFAVAERRAIGDRVRHLDDAPSAHRADAPIDPVRAAPATATVLRILAPEAKP
ncbi:DUF5682 family protein [Actinomadura rupiterrae]|uniref:DUF5682 family protein n=1 Tax=Actinomadura rupiterrae TaxID=559627 RepID=UPI0020A43607|nr:DUF5682 family protein [Actinomadura rupiterrae]MCP2336377.1 hypothetical protein [Actinomadura rupiterrae]